MKRFTILGLAVLAVLAVSAMASASAWAVALPEFETLTNLTATSGAGKLNLTGAGIKSTSAKTTVTATSKTEGTFDIMFEKATLGGEECHSLGDVAELILVLGKLRLVRNVGGGKALVLFIPNETHIECKFAATLVLIKAGSLTQGILGELTPVLTLATAYTLKVVVTGGIQEFTKYEEDAGTAATVKFEGSINGGAFKAATLEQAANSVTALTATKIVKTT
jgi:opacity protein-like surface antigen